MGRRFNGSREKDERETFRVGDQSGEQLLIGVNRSALSLPAPYPFTSWGTWGSLLTVGYFTVLLLQMNQRLLGRM